MSMQSESKDTKEPDAHQSTRDGTGSVATGGTQQSGQQSSQQSAMPPSETDDDQYDQGTVQRAP